MGEPLPGDICDPIRLLTSVVKLKTGIDVKVGDYLVKDGGNDWFTLVTTTTVGLVLDTVTDLGVVQAQADINTTGIVDGIGTVAVFVFQSRIYGFVAAGLNPQEKIAVSVLVDDSPGPAIVGFDSANTTTALGVGRYVKMSGDTVAQISVANGVGVIDLGAA